MDLEHEGNPAGWKLDEGKARIRGVSKSAKLEDCIDNSKTSWVMCWKMNQRQQDLTVAACFISPQSFACTSAKSLKDGRRDVNP